ncbi:ATP-binding cassette domain-containing protein, partial [bacterium]|nr:ATP-binding cassette domain-containing protein [bacterium]
MLLSGSLSTQFLCSITMRTVMQANDLWKLYPSGESTIQAVKGVTLDVSEGEVIAIMGPSGCGKTT